MFEGAVPAGQHRPVASWRSDQLATPPGASWLPMITDESNIGCYLTADRPRGTPARFGPKLASGIFSCCPIRRSARAMPATLGRPTGRGQQGFLCPELLVLRPVAALNSAATRAPCRFDRCGDLVALLISPGRRGDGVTCPSGGSKGR